jgi:hypothetical protein
MILLLKAVWLAMVASALYAVVFGAAPILYDAWREYQLKRRDRAAIRHLIRWHPNKENSL